MLFLKPNLVVIVEVHSPGLADCGEAKYDANEDGWPGCGRNKISWRFQINCCAYQRRIVMQHDP